MAGANDAQLSTWLKRARERIEIEKDTALDCYLVTQIDRGEAKYQAKLVDTVNAGIAAPKLIDGRLAMRVLAVRDPRNFAQAPAPPQSEGQLGFGDLTPDEVRTRQIEEFQRFLDLEREPADAEPPAAAEAVASAG